MCGPSARSDYGIIMPILGYIQFIKFKHPDMVVHISVFSNAIGVINFLVVSAL